MGVPTSEVGYTPAMPRREDHEVHKDMGWHWEGKKKSACVCVCVCVCVFGAFVVLDNKLYLYIYIIACIYLASLHVSTITVFFRCNTYKCYIETYL